MIVVNDGSSDDTMPRLAADLGLVPVEASSRWVLATAPIDAYYKIGDSTRGCS